MARIIFTDRYRATGLQHNGCNGPCDGMGVVPVYLREGDRDPMRTYMKDCTDGELVALWREAEAKKPTDDGWHFVPCPACDGPQPATGGTDA